MPKIIIPVRGMHCRSCELLLETGLKKISGVKKVAADYRAGRVEVHYDNVVPAAEVVKAAVREAGYQVGQKDDLPWFSRDFTVYRNLLAAVLILFILYGLIKWLGILEVNVDTANGGLLVALIVGLVAGVSTCMALVGGLILALSARHAELHPEATAKEKFRPHLYFNLGRVGGYALFGGLIGWLGSAFKLSPNFLGLMTVVVGGVMIFLGLKLIEIFPILSDKTIALPKTVAKFFGLRQETKEYSHQAAAVTGALTFFLPCGFTQAMQLYAVSTGSFWQGATIMFLFALGTAPGLLSVGGLSSIFRGQRARVFFAAAGLAVILLGWYNIANGGRLFSSDQRTGKGGVTGGQVQEVRMTENFNGFEPSVFTVKVGQPVRWIINATAPFSCAASIVVPGYGINRQLQKGENIIEFTPKEVGEIPFSCSMGMYRGKFIVTDGNGSVSGASAGGIVAPIAAGGSCGAAGGSCGGCGGGSSE